MSTKSITGTGLLLAVALLAQSLRLIFPFIPNQVSMFLIGSITSATFVLATWRYGWKNGLVIAWIAPVVAHLQGMLPLPLRLLARQRMYLWHIGYNISQSFYLLLWRLW